MDINATLLGQFITFMLFVWFTMKYVWPPITQAMQQRAQTIASGLEAAEKGRYELESAQNKAKDIIGEAKKQAANIIEQAHLYNRNLLDEAKKQAQQEHKRIVALAQAEIKKEVIQAKEALKGRLSELVMTGVSKVIQVQMKLDPSLHHELLNQLESEL